MDFIRTKFTSLDNKTKVSFQANTGESDAFQLIASGEGVEFQGKFLIPGEQELQDFAKLLSQVWQEHRKLKPKLATSLSGH